ncbi:MAG: hypothetical protein IJT12_06445 [Paludibacteraceae bacterium]|nr:hypothetical protein [Paludibacteraceae bacterium]
MTHSIKRLISSFLIIGALASICSAFALAAYNPPDNQDSSAYLDSYSVGATAKSGGIVAVTADVTAVVNATEIGAKNIYIYEGSSPTGIFTCVAQYSSDDYPLMLGTGYTYYRTPIYYPGTVGKYYYANVQVYVADSTGSDSRMEPTNTVCAHN